MLPVLQIGPAAIQLPALILIAGVWFGSLVAERAALRLGLLPENIERMVFVALLAGVVGARLGHVLRFFDVYLQDPLAVFALTPVTLWPDVGLMTGGVVALVYGQRHHLPLWPTLDALSIGGAAFAVAIALAHLASGNAFGAPASLPWSINLLGAQRHPSQVYELLAAGVALAILLRWRSGASLPGSEFCLFVSLTAAARLVLEAFRGDSLLWFGGVRAAQVISLLVLLAALVLLRRLAQRAAHATP